MRELSLNFQRDHTQARWLTYLLLSFGLMASIGSYVQWSVLTDQISEVELAIQEQSNKSKHKKPALDKVEQQRAEQQASQFKAIQSAMATPWPELLKALEDSKSEKIKLLEISPDPTSKNIRITGEATQLQEVFQYVAALKKESALSDPQLLDHQMIKQDNSPAVHFEVEAKWIQP